MASEKKKICSICQVKYTGFGHNAQPVNDGRCCDKCNGIVITARLNQLYYQVKTEEAD